MRRLVRTSVAATLLLIAGCGSDDATSGAPPSSTEPAETTLVEEPAPVGGLLATIATNRLYAVHRGFGLGLRNVGDTPVVVDEIQLDSPLFEPVPLSAEEVLLQPTGRRFVLPLPYGEARCDEPAPTFTAVVVLETGEELRVPAIEEHPGTVERLHARECGAAAVRERVDLRFGDDWTRDGNDIHGELVLEQRHPGDPVAVEDAAGNVIFTIRVDDDEPPILRVTDYEPVATVPITISADRCDPHALAEVKRLYLFVAWAAVGDAEPVPMDLEPTGAARAAVENLFETCEG